ncbi:N-acetyltransferase family protein [Ligilactobacillus sp. WILCCON 0076]|uniref:N-acetyltransferase family protein n=1 Tax=Ligilactobacillus ubinensis TaxID=2876789 RepID=A0A9X2FKY9_9LACO|nr:GNAT family N-acetyltransferase [Ligilactobacillus ubinensis]MCP0887285.1 N-acetyltransferase family protein [Ligilactobacillus ubinensis]
MSSFSFRIAKKTDAQALLDIYAPYVENTAITLETNVPSLSEFSTRIYTILKKYPYIVAEQNEKIVGYAYVSAFKERAAYDWSVETSIYLAQNIRHQGLGTQLYNLLEKICQAQNITNMNACVTYPRTANDPYVTQASILFHENRGFKLNAHFHNCANKFNRWYDMVWLEKSLLPHTIPVVKVKPFASISHQFFD